jgi:kynurenine formamidase
MQRWKIRPKGSNWGAFGDDDQIGTLNLITPARRRAAILEAKEGIVFQLCLPLDHPRGTGVTPSRHAPILYPTAAYNVTMTPQSHDVFCDDKAMICLQFSTQWDALSHVGAVFDADGDGISEMVYYNGYLAEEHILSNHHGHPHAAALGIERMAETCVQGRGVLADLHAVHGNARVSLGYDALMQLFDAQDVTIQPGDILCLHTGLADIILDRGDRLTREELHESCTVLDGHDDRLLRWITDSGIAAIAADNIGVEIFSMDMAAELLMPLHHHCLFKLGMPLGELWYFRDLANWLRTHGRNRFLLTAPPLRLPGAVGSPVSAVATV